MKSTDIKKIYCNGNEVTSFYWGGNLIFPIIKEPIYTSKTFAGKFTDDSIEDDWKCKINGVDTVLPVDPTTKEFNFEYEGELTSLYQCFNESKLEQIYHIPDTSKVINFGYMFYKSNLKSLDVSDWNFKNDAVDFSYYETKKMIDLYYFCAFCKSLKYVKFPTTQLKTYNNNGSGNFFNGCSSLEKVENLQIYFGNGYIDLFTNCVNLKELKNIKLNFNGGYRNISNGMFFKCNSLTTVNGTIENIKENIDLSDSPLTNESAMVFINGLSEVEETKTIKFKSTTYNTLTEEQIAIATSRGWSIVSA